MAVAFRSSTNTTADSRTNTTGSEPSGAAADDILIATLYIENDITVTPPAGWTQIAFVDSTTQTYDFGVWWIRRGGSAPALTWSHNNAPTQLNIAAYSGCITTGDPQDATASTNQGTDASAEGTAITTANANSMLVYVLSKWDWGRTATPPSGMNERVDGTANYLADVLQVAAGSTGTKTATLNSATVWITVLLALKDAAAGGGKAIPPNLIRRPNKFFTRRVYG